MTGRQIHPDEKDRVVHMALPADRVQSLMADLLTWLENIEEVVTSDQAGDYVSDQVIRLRGEVSRRVTV